MRLLIGLGIGGLAGYFVGKRVARAALPPGRTQLEPSRMPRLDANRAYSDAELRQYALEVQRRLQALGYYRGRLDGIPGEQTRLAIEAFLRARNITVTPDRRGEITAVNAVLAARS